jgi:hypothetical protein
MVSAQGAWLVGMTALEGGSSGSGLTDWLLEQQILLATIMAKSVTAICDSEGGAISASNRSLEFPERASIIGKKHQKLACGNMKLALLAGKSQMKRQCNLSLEEVRCRLAPPASARCRPLIFRFRDGQDGRKISLC